ncbi:hypothetical protein GCM10023168_26350 [Fodinibacter luteus]|uniref:Glycosyltransferase 2-like domain-containing protein n=1 Tax=Fodinibacter luteus TaxID=552064 RepID=A0ABP8KJH0_9MICO
MFGQEPPSSDPRVSVTPAIDPQRNLLNSVCAVVVHHRRFPDVLQTVKAVISAGVRAESVVVVDNSEDKGIRSALNRTSEGWHVHSMRNRGYGAAVNRGVSVTSGSKVVLVLTHEALIDAASLHTMVAALGEDPRIAAVGPGRLTTSAGRIWSEGGELTRLLRLPRHILDGPSSAAAVRDVDWLDGACVAYRIEALESQPFREDFFLYFEETELHCRLRANGWRVVTALQASAHQHSAGMPAYWASRNVVLFQGAHGTALSRILAPPYFLLRAMAIAAKGREWDNVAAGVRGLLAGYAALRRTKQPVEPGAERVAGYSPGWEERPTAARDTAT